MEEPRLDELHVCIDLHERVVPLVRCIERAIQACVSLTFREMRELPEFHIDVLLCSNPLADPRDRGFADMEHADE
jgi:hypothetical protein